MKTFVLSFLGGLAALLLFFIVLPIVLLLTFVPKGEPPPKKNVVLSLDLRQSMNDQPAGGEGLGSLFANTSFVEVLLRLNTAATDPNVKGLYIRAAEAELGSSRAEELREAIKRMRAGGKFVIAHSQGFMATGPAPYRAISGADEIWLQPGSGLEAPGIAFETLFFGRAFAKFHVTADMDQFYEYKNAVDQFKQSGYTKPHAEAMTALAQSVWTTSLADIAADRAVPLKAAADGARGAAPGQGPLAQRIAGDNAFSGYLGNAKALLEHSPYTADEAKAVGLVDKTGWPEEAADAAKAKAGAGAELLKIEDYRPAPRRGSSKGAIAIVGGEGDIVTGGEKGFNPLSAGSPEFASDIVSKKLLALLDDDTVKAVVFRIDSGGGSATASDQIWRAVKRLQEKGKKVVVSMGSMAASGGYYVAAGADRIVATRATITGSIGVFGGKFAIADAMREFGIDPATVYVGGDYTTAYGTEKMTDSQKKAQHAQLQAVYDRFTGLVAEGRHLPIETVRDIARGRIWSGDDALQRKLVDRTGDLIVAIEEAKKLMGVAADDRVEIRLPNNRQKPLDMLTHALTSADAGMPEAAMMEAVAAVVGRQRAAVVVQQLHHLSTQTGVQTWTPTIIEH
jgi:protease-4